MKRVKRWFKTRQALYAELHVLDRMVRELQGRSFLTERCLDEYDEMFEDMQAEIVSKTQKLEADELLLSALGAITEVRSND